MPQCKKRRLAHNNPKIIDKVMTNNPSGSSNCGKIPPVAAGNSQQTPKLPSKVNCKGNGISNVDSLLNNVKLKKKSKQQKSSIAGLLRDVSSKNLSLSDYFVRETKSDSDSGQTADVVSSSSVGYCKNGIPSSPAVYSGHNSQARNLTNGHSQENELSRYKSSNGTSTPMDKPSQHNGISVFDISKQISPVPSSNSFHSAFNNKESKTTVGKYY